MIFTRTVKADHSTPGYRWTVNKAGTIIGSLYQTWPHRMKARFKPAAVAAVLPTLFGLGGYVYGIGDYIGLYLGWLPATYIIFLLWPFWPGSLRVGFDPVKQVMIVEGRRYDLNEVNNFNTVKKSYKPGKDAEFITFNYGRKTIKLKVSNPFDHAFRIVGQFHSFQEDILSGEIHPDNVTDKVEATKGRAAAF